MHISLLLLRLWSLFLLIVSAEPVLPAVSTAGRILRLTLHRRPDFAGVSRLENVRAMFYGDQRRQQMIAGQISRRRKAYAVSPCPKSGAELAMEMPVWSGAYTGTGQYFVRVRLGTPAQPFLLVPDTGSDLTWVTCRYRVNDSPDSLYDSVDPAASVVGRRRKGARPPRPDRRLRRVFDADLSRSFHPIACSSDLCRTELPFSLTTCPTAASPCAYDYVYAQGSSAQGFFANESATVELSDQRRIKLKGLVVGCTSSAEGSSFVASDGVLALGHGPNTFVSRATARFGRRFSYCLVDHLSSRNATGYLTFGPNPDLLPHTSSYAATARLILEPRLEPFYFVAVAGLSVSGKVLRIPRRVWNERHGGGAILDSGTTLTVLVEPAYRAVVAALSSHLACVPRIEIDPFEYCYNWSAPEASDTAVPDLTLHFVGSAKMSPPTKSYLIDVAPGVKCIGFTSTPWPGVSTIGNILQQEHIWEFDLQNQQLRFHRSNCTAGSYYH